MISDARRLMDRQYDAIERGEQKAAGLLRLAIVSLAFGLSLGLFIHRTNLSDIGACYQILLGLLLLIGFAIASAGIGLAGHATVRIIGPARNLEEAPNAGWVVEQLDARVSEQDYKLSLIQGIRDAAQVTGDRMLDHEKQRTRAMQVVAAGGLSFLLVAAFLGVVLLL